MENFSEVNIVTFMLATTLLLAMGFILWSQVRLSRSEREKRFLLNLFDCLDKGFFVLDDQGQVRSVSNADLLDLVNSQAEFVGKNFSEVFPYMLMPSGLVTEFDQSHLRSLEFGKLMGKQNCLYGVFDKNKQVHWVRFKSRVFKKAEFRDGVSVGGKIIVTVEDATDYFEQEKLIEQQKKRIIDGEQHSALGQMAVGITHEILNPLASLKGHAEMLKKRSDRDGVMDPERATRLANLVIEMVDRVSKIMFGMKRLGKNMNSDIFAPVQIKTVVEDTLIFCRHRVQRSDVKLSIPEIDDSLVVDCYETQLGQVLLNLILNSYDAIVDLEEKWIQVAVDDLGERVRFSITDSGKGIPKEFHEKIFEPYYTTKSSGKGTGMGMMITKRMVEEHGGTIFIDSRCENTRFVVEVPKKRTLTISNELISEVKQGQRAS